MNSENNSLPPFVIAALYKDDLVLIDQQKLKNRAISGNLRVVEEAVQATKISYLGNNQKNITILLNDSTAVHVADESLQFLTAILAACKLNMGDVAIVNLANQTVDFTAIKAALKPTTILLFDVSAASITLPFEVPHYQVQAYDNCTLLFSAPLESMLLKNDMAKLEKGKLWNALKKTFNV